jgi:hypothetical protein
MRLSAGEPKELRKHDLLGRARCHFIGRAAALAFAREGVNVVVLGLGDGDGA